MNPNQIHWRHLWGSQQETIAVDVDDKGTFVEMTMPGYELWKRDMDELNRLKQQGSANTMSKQVTKSFKVDAEAWANFVRSDESYGATPAELLREFVGHADAAMKGIESGRIRSFDGNVCQLIRTEFPQLSPFQLRVMAEVLMQAAKLGEKERRK